MVYARIKKLRDGRVMIRARGPRGVEFCAVAPRGMLTVGGQGPYPTIGGVDEVGGIFDDIAKVASKVLHNKYVQAGAATVLSLYGVPPGATAKSMKIAGDLVDGVRAGTPAARAKARRIARAAREGNPAAQTAQRVALHVARAQKHARVATEVVQAAVRGDPEARRRLEAVAARARANPNDAAAQQAARAVRAVVQAVQHPPRVLRGGGQPAPSSSPRVAVTTAPDGRRRVTVDV